MNRETFGQMATPIMRQEEALTSVLAQLHDFGVSEGALKRVGILKVGDSLSGETKNGVWQLIKDGETSYQIRTGDKK